MIYYLIISQKKIFTNEIKYSNIIIIKNCSPLQGKQKRKGMIMESDQRTMKSADERKTPGLYDPSFEHDNCGIGAVVNIKGIKSHKTVASGFTYCRESGASQQGKDGRRKDRRRSRYHAPGVS